jgi:hypothetical protein
MRRVSNIGETTEDRKRERASGITKEVSGEQKSTEKLRKREK